MTPASTSCQFSPGDRIRIVRGAVAGLTGIVSISSRADCIIAIDSWPEGAYVRMTSAALEPLEPETRGKARMARVLIVDDSPDTCEALARYLTATGHEVHCAPNGREALTEVLRSPPDVVLLDMLMPVMDGPAFLEVVRSYLRFQSLPVVVLTAFTDSPMVERARTLNVNSVLAKGRASSEAIQNALQEAIVHVPA